MSAMEPIFTASGQTYGRPRITAGWQQSERRCGKNRVARLRREHSIQPRQKRRRWRPITTDSKHQKPVAEHWLAKGPAPARADQTWVADLPYIDSGEGWLSLAGLLDGCSRRGVGWQVGESMEAVFVSQAWQKAVRLRHPEPGLLPHSERGGEAVRQWRHVSLARAEWGGGLDGVARATVMTTP